MSIGNIYIYIYIYIYILCDVTPLVSQQKMAASHSFYAFFYGLPIKSELLERMKLYVLNKIKVEKADLIFKIKVQNYFFIKVKIYFMYFRLITYTTFINLRFVAL